MSASTSPGLAPATRAPIRADAASSGAVGVLDGSSGTQSLQVGATMTVPAAQPLGTYTGSLTVTVVYN